MAGRKLIKDPRIGLGGIRHPLPHGSSLQTVAPGVGTCPGIRSRAVVLRTPDRNGPAPRGNYYQTLQIKPYAGTATIRGAYRRLAMQAHPDVNRAPDATQQMQAVNEAYAILRDPGRRATYDRSRFARALQDAYAGVPAVPTAPPTPSARLRYRARRLGMLRTLGTALTMIGIAGLVWAQGSGWQPRPPIDPAAVVMHIQLPPS